MSHTSNNLPQKLPDFSTQIYLNNDFATYLLEMRKKKWDTWEAFLLNYDACQLAIPKDSQELLVLAHLQEYWRQNHFLLYPHQIAAVHKVIFAMHGRAILADEVGLGKTIEAGMIIKEYLLRGLIQQFLILTPAALCQQWEAELREKFQIAPLIASREHDWNYHNFLIASLDTAKREANREIIFKKEFDLIIVDEAHRLKSTKTQNWQFVNNIQKKYFLLLTATPLQNDLQELFNLISLLRPGHLGSYHTFKKNYTIDKYTPQNASALKGLLEQVLIRNKHTSNQIFTKRFVQDIPVAQTPVEAELYQKITAFVRKGFEQQATGPLRALPLITLQREICSSTFAAMLTLYKMTQKLDEAAIEPGETKALFALAQQVKENSKMAIVEELINKSSEKIIIFTEFLATQSYIRTRLEQKGVLTLAFDGSLSARKKEFTKYEFKQRADYRVLVCTESGGEGINLQFCNTLINYDLPWNPMRLEQRIGRIHRLGQERDVYIYNLSTTGTIEEHLLKLLHQKVKMFEMVLGESERVINNLSQSKSFESRIMEMILKANNQTELAAEFGKLGEEIEGLILDGIN